MRKFLATLILTSSCFLTELQAESTKSTVERTLNSTKAEQGIGMSDPHARVFQNRVYLYTGHDESPKDKTWVMKKWQIFSTDDLVNWRFENYIHPKDNYMGDGSSDCWAGDAAEANGNYYFYFSDRKRGIGVMQSKSPSGPFKDALGKALVAPMHDPTILRDKAQKSYIVYGDKEGGGFHVASSLSDF